jgi:hypothetical protein
MEDRFPNAKVLVAQLKAGDAFKIRSGGVVDMAIRWATGEQITEDAAGLRREVRLSCMAWC